MQQLINWHISSIRWRITFFLLSKWLINEMKICLIINVGRCMKVKVTSGWDTRRCPRGLSWEWRPRSPSPWPCSTRCRSWGWGTGTWRGDPSYPEHYYTSFQYFLGSDRSSRSHVRPSVQWNFVENSHSSSFGVSGLSQVGLMSHVKYFVLFLSIS